MKFSHRFSRPSLQIAIAAALTSPALFAQDPAAAPDPGLDEVVVTGTRVAARTRIDSLAPVDVLSTETLTSQATTAIDESLENMAPTHNLLLPSITSHTDTVQPAYYSDLSQDPT